MISVSQCIPGVSVVEFMGPTNHHRDSKLHSGTERYSLCEDYFFIPAAQFKITTIGVRLAS
jgi:hypothetical protein